MKQIDKNSYCLAWQALFDCIARGEKEQALGVFRLLSRSVQNDALVHHLKGDLYVAFGDVALAIAQYEIAVRLYRQLGQTSQALALSEGIIEYTHRM